MMDRAMNQSTLQSHKIFLHISKCLPCNTERNITVEDKKKKNNKANFINMYTNIYTYIVSDKNDSK